MRGCLGTSGLGTKQTTTRPFTQFLLLFSHIKEDGEDFQTKSKPNRFSHLDLAV